MSVNVRPPSSVLDEPRPPLLPVDEDEAASLQHIDDGVGHGAVAVYVRMYAKKRGCELTDSPTTPRRLCMYVPDAAHGGVERQHRLRKLRHDGHEVLPLLQVQSHELDLLLHQANAHARAGSRRQRPVPVLRACVRAMGLG